MVTAVDFHLHNQHLCAVGPFFYSHHRPHGVLVVCLRFIYRAVGCRSQFLFLKGVIIAGDICVARIHHKEPAARFGKEEPPFVGFIPAAPFLRSAKPAERVTLQHALCTFRFAAFFPLSDCLVEEADVVVRDPPCFDILVYGQDIAAFAAVKPILVAVVIIQVGLFVGAEHFKGIVLVAF